MDILMGTFSKSLASIGGYMAAREDVVEFVRLNSRPFIFSASMTPAAVCCARAALEILRGEPQRVARLAELSAYMRRKLKEEGADIIESQTPIIPIYTYENDKTFLALPPAFGARRVRQPRHRARGARGAVPAAHELCGDAHRGIVGRGRRKDRRSPPHRERIGKDPPSGGAAAAPPFVLSRPPLPAGSGAKRGRGGRKNPRSPPQKRLTLFPRYTKIGELTKSGSK